MKRSVCYAVLVSIVLLSGGCKPMHDRDGLDPVSDTASVAFSPNHLGCKDIPMWEKFTRIMMDFDFSSLATFRDYRVCLSKYDSDRIECKAGVLLKIHSRGIPLDWHNLTRVKLKHFWAKCEGKDDHYASKTLHDNTKVMMRKAVMEQAMEHITGELGEVGEIIHKDRMTNHGCKKASYWQQLGTTMIKIFDIDSLVSSRTDHICLLEYDTGQMLGHSIQCNAVAVLRSGEAPSSVINWRSIGLALIDLDIYAKCGGKRKRYPSGSPLEESSKSDWENSLASREKIMKKAAFDEAIRFLQGL